MTSHPRSTRRWAWWGRGPKRLGTTGKFWTDHADIRPMVLALAGLRDDFAHQGRLITELMDEGRDNFKRLAAVYKQIDAALGQLSVDSLAFATRATLSTSAGDQTYIDADIRWESRINPALPLN